MPIKDAARKALRQSIHRRQRNVDALETLRKLIKKTRKLIGLQKPEEASVSYRALAKMLDKLAKRGILKKNTASRYKSRVAKAVNRIKK